MKDIKSLIGWFAALFMLLFILFCAWDYFSFRFRDHEKRIAALERSARPLIIVDKYSRVEVQGEEVFPEPDRTQTLAEEIVAENREAHGAEGIEK
jgi:hypothetical protein